MKREEVKSFLVGELRNVPTREVCRSLTKEDLQVIAKWGLRFMPIEAFLEEDVLFFTADEIPDLWFQLVLYFILNTKRYENSIVYYDDAKIWDMSDVKTLERMQRTKELLGIDDEIAVTEIEEFLDYVYSDKADF